MAPLLSCGVGDVLFDLASLVDILHAYVYLQKRCMCMCILGRIKQAFEKNPSLVGFEIPTHLWRVFQVSVFRSTFSSTTFSRRPLMRHNTLGARSSPRLSCWAFQHQHLLLLSLFTTATDRYNLLGKLLYYGFCINHLFAILYYRPCFQPTSFKLNETTSGRIPTS